jgi:hypothetical protein
MTPVYDERVRVEQIALNARQIEFAIRRLMPRLDAGEVASCGLEEGRKVFAKLAERYEAAGRRGPPAAR